MENGESMLKRALLLKPQDRFLLLDGLIRRLDKPDKKIDEIWSAEAEKRLKAHREWKTQDVSFKTVFGEEL